jgi:hypothetical protein
VYYTDQGNDHVAGSYEKGTEPSGSMKRGAFEQHSNNYILKDCIPHNCAGQNIGYISGR